MNQQQPWLAELFFYQDYHESYIGNLIQKKRKKKKEENLDKVKQQGKLSSRATASLYNMWFIAKVLKMHDI